MPTHRVAAGDRVTYRRTTVADLETLVDHRHRMWSDIGHRTEADISEHDARYRAWARSRLRSGELVGYVAETDAAGPVASGLVWYRLDQPRPGLRTLVSPYLLSMYTEPGWRGRGIATRLVKELLGDIRRRGYPNALLHASRFGRSVYARVGFERTWEMLVWLDRKFAPRTVPARRRGKKRKGLDRGR